MIAEKTLTGTILHLQRLSTEDGPGIRTTVFFKGCPLRCKWCHNPESLTRQPQIQWLENRCIGCHTCLQVCPQGALSLGASGEIRRDRSKCSVCGSCAEACPAEGMELLGKPLGVEELAAELLKDRVYFAKSNGGVTFSGGEPTLQPDFAAALAARLGDQGVPVALDTCGLCPPETLERLLPLVELVLFDLKLMDARQHERWTGASNRLILDNLRRIGRWQVEHPTLRLWVRTPLIPGATATPENLSAISAFLGRELGSQVERWELCAFNNLCRDKYRRLDLAWEFAETSLMTATELAEAERWAQMGGFNPQRTFVTGAAKVEL